MLLSVYHGIFNTRKLYKQVDYERVLHTVGDYIKMLLFFFMWCALLFWPTVYMLLIWIINC